MIYDNDAEICRQCTLKHLTTAMVSLTDEESPEMLRKVYFCGNLSHAANHFVKLDEFTAEEIRALRIDAQDDHLDFKLSVAVIKERLLGIIEKVTTFEPPKTPVAPEKPTAPPPAQPSAVPVQKRRCPCHAHA